MEEFLRGRELSLIEVVEVRPHTLRFEMQTDTWINFSIRITNTESSPPAIQDPCIEYSIQMVTTGIVIDLCQVCGSLEIDLG